MFTRRNFLAASATLLATPAFSQTAETEPLPPIRLALVAPKPGDDYYNACRQGALEAAAEIGNVQLSYLAPAMEDGKLQAEILARLVDDRFDALVVSPLSADVVISACARAVQAGIKVISIGNALPPDARLLHVGAPDVTQTAPQLFAILATALGRSGEVALLSSAPQAADHIAFTTAMQRELLKGEYSELALVTTVFGQDRLQESYAETLAIVQAFPNLRGIVAPSFGGLAGAARAVMDLGRSSTLKVTGLGLPSRIAPAMQAGVVPGFLTWSPVEIGYAATHVAAGLAKAGGADIASAGLAAGRVGTLAFDDSGATTVGELISVDATSIDKYAELF